MEPVTDLEEASIPGLLFIAMVLSAAFSFQYCSPSLSPEKIAETAISFVVMTGVMSIPLIILQQLAIKLLELFSTRP